jgi:D-amino-acid dehydrogenase
VGKHVLIIGGGVVGLCAAYFAARVGFQVTLVERSTRDHHGTSWGNAGMVVPSHVVPLAAPGMVALGLKWMLNPESPFYVRPRPSAELLSWGWKFTWAANRRQVARAAPLLRDLHLASRTLYEELEGELGGIGLEQRGLLMLCRTETGLAKEAKAAAFIREVGIPAEVLTPDEVRALEPGLDMNIRGAVYFPKDSYLNPGRLLEALKCRLEQSGVKFLWETAVTGVNVREGRVTSVSTTKGELAGDEVVLAAGVWSRELAKPLSVKLPLQAGKGYSLTLPEPKQLPQVCALLSEAHMAMTPLGDSLRFGGTLELTGIDEHVSPSRVRGIIKSIPQYFPAFKEEDFANITSWAGLRPCSPDGLPYLGHPANVENLILATSHAMMGISLAPVTGKLVGELLEGREPTIDLNLLRPDRFQKGERA